MRSLVFSSRHNIYHISICVVARIELLYRESFDGSKRGQLEVKTNALHPFKAPNKYILWKIQISFRCSYKVFSRRNNNCHEFLQCHHVHKRSLPKQQWMITIITYFHKSCNQTFQSCPRLSWIVTFVWAHQKTSHLSKFKKNIQIGQTRQNFLTLLTMLKILKVDNFQK